MCPERTAEGSALKEIHYLPQIIGSKNNFVKKNLVLFLKRLQNKLFILIHIKRPRS